jgi:hypothetical protein
MPPTSWPAHPTFLGRSQMGRPLAQEAGVDEHRTDGFARSFEDNVKEAVAGLSGKIAPGVHRTDAFARSFADNVKEAVAGLSGKIAPRGKDRMNRITGWPQNTSRQPSTSVKTFTSGRMMAGFALMAMGVALGLLLGLRSFRNIAVVSPKAGVSKCAYPGFPHPE